MRCGSTTIILSLAKHTFFDAETIWPFLNHFTVGVGAPVIGTVIVNVSPTVDCTLRALADRRTAGTAKIGQ